MEELQLDLDLIKLDNVEHDTADDSDDDEDRGVEEEALKAVSAFEEAFRECVQEAVSFGHDAPSSSSTAAAGPSELHALLRTGLSAEAISEHMFASNPELERKDKVGNLPLHVAAESNTPIETVTVLLALAPRAAEAKNFRGALPIELALSCFSKRYHACLSCGDKMRKVDCSMKKDAAMDGMFGRRLSAFALAIETKDDSCSLCPLVKLNNIPMLEYYYHCKACSLSTCSRCMDTKPQTRKFMPGTAVDVRAPLGFRLSVRAARVRDKDVLSEIADQFCTATSVIIPADALSVLVSSHVNSLSPALASVEALSLEFDVTVDASNAESIVLRLMDSVKANSEEGKALFIRAVSSGAPPRIISDFLAAYPLAMGAKDPQDSLPLHLALHAGAPTDTCLMLLERDLAALRHKNKRGYLPLHMAASNNASSDTVAAILSAYPEAASVKSKSGRLPLQYALMSRNPNEQVVKIVLDAYPAGASEVDSDGDVALYFAIMQQSSELVSLLLKRCPESAQIRNKKGQLPLHIALRSSAALEIVEAMLIAYPAAAADSTSDHELPIHIALTKRAAPECISALLRSFPEAAAKSNSSGVPPSHMATSLPILEALVAVHSNLASADRNTTTGELPLHAVLSKTAALGDAAEPLVRRLLELHPEAASIQSGLSTSKFLPVALALKNKASFATVEALLGAYPEAIDQRFGSVGGDPNASLLQCALTWGCSPDTLIFILDKSQEDVCFTKGILSRIVKMRPTLDLVERLLITNSAAASEHDPKTGNYPLHVAVSEEVDFGIIKCLVDMYPAATSAADEDGDLPLHVMKYSIDALTEPGDASSASTAAAAPTDAPPVALSATDAGSTSDSDIATIPSSPSPVPMPEMPKPKSVPYLRAVITLLLQHNPAGLRVANKKGKLPVHLACASLTEHEDIIRLLVENYPEGTAIKDKDDYLPITYACHNHAKLPIIRLLLDHDPSSAEFRNNGYNMLHYYFKAGSDKSKPAEIEVIDVLLQRCPELANESNNLQYLPVHYAVRQAAHLDIIKHLLSLSPQAPSLITCNKETLFHMAVQQDPVPLELLRLLLPMNPAACATKTAEGDWPFIHLADQLDENSPPELLDLVEDVLGAFPSAAGKANSVNDLVLHEAFTRRIVHDESAEDASFNVRMLDMLTKHTTREILSHQGECDYLPLHLACKLPNTPLAVVQRMCEIYPEGCGVANNVGAGNLPLHYAVRDGCELEVVKLLLKTWPAATSVPNGDGLLPLCVALKNNASSQVVMALLAADPASIYSEIDGILPIVYAIRQKNKELILALLLSDLPQPPAVDVFAAGVNKQFPDEGEGEYEREGPLSAAIARSMTLTVDDGDETTSYDEMMASPCFCRDRKFDNTKLFFNSDDNFAALADSTDPALKYVRMHTKDALPDPLLREATTDEAHGAGASWGEFIIYSAKLSAEMVVEIVKTVFDQNANIVHYLARYKDSNGREAITIATGELRALMLQYILFYGRFELQPGKPVHRSATATVYYATCHEFTPRTPGPPLPGSPDRRRSSMADAFNNTKNLSGFFDTGEHESPQGRRFSTNFRPPLESPRASLPPTDPADSNRNSTTKQVALKFMRDRSQFDHETSARLEHDLDPNYVVHVIECFDADADDDYFSELTRLGADLQEFRYCMVMPAGDRTLKEIIDKERIASRDFDEVRNISVRVARALGHLHQQGRIHGDLKPLNIMRLGADIRLIDLDASCAIDAVAGKKWSSAYLPPEMFVVDPASGLVRVVRETDPSPVLARPSHDMWSFGCVLYHLFSGEALFHSNDEDNITDQATLARLMAWTAQTKRHKLLKINSLSARNLVSQLLCSLPSARPPTVEHILAHPFFTGRSPGRMIGSAPDFDVFLSYRWFADDDVVAELYDQLTTAGLSVWLDKKQLKHGLSWEEGFCDGLIKSRCFVPVISRAGIKTQFENLRDTSECDNVLLEHRFALELNARGLMERIFPLFVGELDAATGERGHFFRSGCNLEPLSTAVVASVEDKLLRHLDRQALGMPFTEDKSVREVWLGVTSNLGGFVVGFGEVGELVRPRAEEIVAMVTDLRKGDVDSEEEGEGSTRQVQAELLDTRQRLQSAEEEIQRLSTLLKGAALTRQLSR